MFAENHPIRAALRAAALGCAALAPSAGAAVRVVTTTPTLADIARNVGGDLVEVESIMHGPENVHDISPRPSSMMKLRRADLFVHGGLDGEPWVPALVQGARQPRLLPGAEGYIDASLGIRLKEIPSRAQLSRALGDIHVYGNTHYALDPLNGVVIATTIAAALSRQDPAHRNEYLTNAEAYGARLRALTDRLVAEMAPWRGTPVATYHRAWPYFLERFDLERVAEVEPKPNIPPGPGALSDCVEAMKAAGARIVIVEPYSPRRSAETVARRAGGRAVVLAHEVGAKAEADTYERLFEYDVRLLLATFRDLGIEPGHPASPAANPAGSH
jgi:zinc/manganese transport system substrate-binding protein